MGVVEPIAPGEAAAAEYERALREVVVACQAMDRRPYMKAGVDEVYVGDLMRVLAALHKVKPVGVRHEDAMRIMNAATLAATTAVGIVATIATRSVTTTTSHL